MAIDYAQLKVDDAAGHPDTGPFDADPAIAATEWNALNRSAEGGVDGMLHYMIINRSKTNSGTDFTATPIIGRLYAAANGVVGDNLFGATGPNLNMVQIHSARLFLTLIASPHLTSLDFENTEVDFAYDALAGGASGAKVWRPEDSDALKGLSQNQQSYASERGYGRLRAGDIAQARAG